MTEYVKNMRKHIGHARLMIVGAAVILRRQDGCILLQKRRDNDCWGLHGGCVEPGEACEAAARRELWEETGLTAGQLTLFGVFSGPEMLYTYPNGDMVSNVCTVYICEDFSGNALPETEETAGLCWFFPTSLPDNISPPDKPVLEAYLRSLS